MSGFFCDLHVLERGAFFTLAEVSAEEPRPEILHQRMDGQRTAGQDDIGECPFHSQTLRQDQIERVRIAFEELAFREMVARRRVGPNDRRRRGRGSGVVRSGPTVGERDGQERDERNAQEPGEGASEGLAGGDCQAPGEADPDHSSTAAHELINVGAVGVGKEIEMGLSLSPLGAETPPTSPTSEKAPGVNPVVV